MAIGKSFRVYSFFGAFFLVSLLGQQVFAQTTPKVAKSVGIWVDKYEDIFNRWGIPSLRNAVKNRDDAHSLTYRAKLALIDADLLLAEKLAERAYKSVKQKEVRGIVLVHYSQALAANNKNEKAEKILREGLSQDPMLHQVRLQLGELLMRQGKKAEAEIVLDVLASFFNKKRLKNARDLTLVSKAMLLTDAYKDANYAMERAIEKDPKYVPGLVHWGYLFLAKYNRGDALQSFKEALAASPNSIDALVGVARTELELGNDFPKIRELLAKAEKLSPLSVDVNLVYADIAIKDSDCTEARRRSRIILKARPQNLEALSLIATCSYLDDNIAQFEKELAEILKINPQYAQVFSTAATYGVRVHRYKEGVALHRRALAIDSNFSKAMLGIGIGLSRMGDEEGAHDMLKRAFEIDPFNVRTFNMLELYEKELKNYEIIDYPRFQLRVKTSEKNVVNAVVPPLVTESMEAYDRQYKFKPEKFLSVEVFPEPAVFGVRSVGLPNISPQGVCFGNTVVARSPSDGNFNWAQVIWHEMAHVYHIQLSKNRVPRWFTEGLAEYETNIKDPNWARYNDRELSKALKSGELRGVLTLSKGFTHARSYGEILRSYQQASLVIHFIAETYGYDSLPQMLRAWGAKKKTPEVLKTVLKLDAKSFDEGFEKWLRKKYMKFGSQFSVDLASIPTAIEIADALKSAPNNATLWAKLAIAKLRVADKKGAEAAMMRAIETSEKNAKGAPKNPEVNLIAMYYYYDRGRIKDAYKHGLLVLDATQDSYDIRFILGKAAQKLEQKKSAEIHFWTATQLWPDGIDAWRALSRIYKKNKSTKKYEEALDRIFQLQHHNPNIARQYAEYWSTRENWAKVGLAAQRWFEVNPFDVRGYHYGAESSLRNKDLEAAKENWRLWSVVRSSDKQKRILSSIELLAKTGYKEEALQKAKEAREMKIPSAKIEKALKP